MQHTGTKAHRHVTCSLTFARHVIVPTGAVCVPTEGSRERARTRLGSEDAVMERE